MKKQAIAILSVFMLVFTIGFAAAEDNQTMDDKWKDIDPTMTAVSGNIYGADDSTPVEGADVTVTCYNGDKENVKKATTSETGSYAVVFQEKDCAVGDTVMIEAQKDSATGSSEGTIGHDKKCLVNTGIVDVSIPEFGVIAGAVALVGALGIFAYRRKE